MFDIKYYKDLSHNYLIIKGIKDSRYSYHFRMITENKMIHFLQCNDRRIDNETLLYYEISSKQSLRLYFAQKVIGYQQLKELFDSIKLAVLEAEDYLLPSDGVCLHPDCIFYDLTQKNYSFIYYPDNSSKQEMEIQFAEYLVDRADYEDDYALDITYKIFELVQDETFLPLCAEKLFQKKSCESGEMEAIQKESYIKSKEIEKSIEVSTEYYNEQASNVPGVQEEDEVEEWEIEGIGDNRVRIIITVVAMIAGFLAAAALCYMRFLFLFTTIESAFILLGALVLFVAAMVMCVYLFGIVNQKINCRKKHNIYDLEELNREDPKKITFDEYMPELLYDKNNYETIKKQIPINAVDEMEVELYGNTTYMEKAVNRCENKLYGMNKGNKYHISLKKMPLTVGKLAGGVDYTIKEPSVSRMHARFSAEGDRIFIMDLNSTNGTFKNGLRLEPNEICEIEQGDEIRLGQMDFVYR